MQVVARGPYDVYVAPFPGASGDGIGPFDKGQTRQADAAGVDINQILKRYEKTGTLPDLIREDARYGDFSEAPDFQEALNLVEKAKLQFAALDPTVRSRFDNDPAKFLAFMHDPDPKVVEESFKLGLRAKPKYETKIEGDFAVVYKDNVEISRESYTKPV